jgi:hypothetical protein
MECKGREEIFFAYFCYWKFSLQIFFLKIFLYKNFLLNFYFLKFSNFSQVSHPFSLTSILTSLHHSVDNRNHHKKPIKRFFLHHFLFQTLNHEQTQLFSLIFQHTKPFSTFMDSTLISIFRPLQLISSSMWKMDLELRDSNFFVMLIDFVCGEFK